MLFGLWMNLRSILNKRKFVPIIFIVPLTLNGNKGENRNEENLSFKMDKSDYSTIYSFEVLLTGQN